MSYKLFLLFLLTACAHNSTPFSKWKQVENRPHEPVTLKTYIDEDGNFLKRIEQKNITKEKAISIFRGRKQELKMLSERLIEPYFGTIRSEEGCLDSTEIAQEPIETADSILKVVHSLSSKDFFLLGCKEKERFFYTYITYLYCKKSMTYIESRYYFTKAKTKFRNSCDSF